jgi:hypothetical protein
MTKSALEIYEEMQQAAEKLREHIKKNPSVRDLPIDDSTSAVVKYSSR